jgi:hypothetical protein
MNRTVQTQTDKNLPPEILLEAFSAFAKMLVTGVRIVDANQNPDKTLRHIQKCLEAGARELSIDPNEVGKMFREMKKTEKNGETQMKKWDINITRNSVDDLVEKVRSGEQWVAVSYGDPKTDPSYSCQTVFAPADFEPHSRERKRVLIKGIVDPSDPTVVVSCSYTWSEEQECIVPYSIEYTKEKKEQLRKEAFERMFENMFELTKAGMESHRKHIEMNFSHVLVTKYDKGATKHFQEEQKKLLCAMKLVEQRGKSFYQELLTRAYKLGISDGRQGVQYRAWSDRPLDDVEHYQGAYIHGDGIFCRAFAEEAEAYRQGVRDGISQQWDEFIAKYPLLQEWRERYGGYAIHQDREHLDVAWFWCGKSGGGDWVVDLTTGESLGCGYAPKIIQEEIDKVCWETGKSF